MNWYGQSKENGGYGEPLDKILWSYLHAPTGYVVECGAGDGVWLSTCKAFEDAGWYCLNIEATKSEYEKLVINRPLATNLHLALWDRDGERLELDEYEEAGLNGITTISKHAMMANRPSTGRSTVLSARYKSIVDQWAKYSNHEIDLFVLDVEGAELKAIEGMQGTSYWPRAMCVEHTHVGLENLNKVLINYSLKWQDQQNALWIRC